MYEVEGDMAATPRGFGISTSVAPEVVTETAKEVEALGYSALWTNNPPGQDGLQNLRIASKVTERIQLGVGVIPFQRHPAAEIVERTGVGTPESLPLDRLLLGVGSANPGAITRVRENIAALREALDCHIYLAALGPQMCRLAGEIADGVLFNWLTPDFARHQADLVREGAEKAGRPTPRLVTYVRVALGPDGHAKLQSEANRYGQNPAYAAHFERMGVSGYEASIPASNAEEIQEGLKAWDGVLDEIVVRSITSNDTLEETLALVRGGAPSAG
jgi:alkanesulfonate monooxygenase SsuD/methylene tetrahydromethanopterin reductase-like flavin-dependent oxidoreductase (luciferase family)